MMFTVTLGAGEVASLVLLNSAVADIIDGDMSEGVLEELKATQEDLWNIILKIGNGRNES